MTRRLAAPLLLLSLLHHGCNGSAGGPSSPPPAETAAPVASAPPLVPTVDVDAILGDQLDPDPREKILATSVAELLTRQHLQHFRLDDEVSERAFGEFLEGLDSGKLFLLQTHVDALKTFSTRMDDELRRGDLSLARRATALMLKRREAVASIVASVLTQPFDFTKDENVETDPDKLQYARTEEELRNRWRKSLKLQVLERVAQLEQIEKARKDPKADKDKKKEGSKVLKEIPPTFEGKEKKAREELATSFSARFARLGEVDALDPTEAFINAVAAVYDPHTQYLAPADKDNFDIAMTGSLQGIGAVLGEEDHYIVVRELVPGGASWRAGELEANDLILAVAQDGEDPVDVTDMPIDQVVQMIRGPKGTVVTLTVKKTDETVTDISITRDVVEIEASYARGAVLSAGGGRRDVGYIFLPSFYDNQGAAGVVRNATEDIRRLLDTFRQRKVPGIILDLRSNGGGLLSHARDITGLFIDSGPVVQTRASDGEREILTDPKPGAVYDGQVIVLVDRFSASASEILAGALQDYRRALVVGTGPTHGKGTVQVLLDLDRLRGGAPGDPLGVFKLTVQQYFRVTGDSTQWRGVAPDVVLPDPTAFIESGERFLDHSIPWSETEGLTFKKEKPAWNVKELVTHSASRQQKEIAFSKVAARSDLLKKRREDSLVPLSKAAWEKKRDKDKADLEAVELNLDETDPRFKVDVLDPVAGSKAASVAQDEAVKERLKKWRDDLARDPWVDESYHLLEEMIAAR